MTPGVLRLAPIVARIAATCPLFRAVGDAAAYARLRDRPLVWPSAYVLPLGDQAGRSRYASHEVAQPVTARIAVVLIARDLRRDGGAEAMSELEEARVQLRTALLGWTPPEASDHLLLVRGQLASDLGADGLLVWQDDWACALDARTIP